MAKIRFLSANYMFCKFNTWYDIPDDTNIFLYIIIILWRTLSVIIVAAHLVSIILYVILTKEAGFLTTSLNVLNVGLYGGSLTRMIYYLYKRKNIKPMIDQMNAIYKQEFSNDLVEFSTEPYEKFIKRLFYCWMVFVHFTAICLPLITIILMDKDNKYLPISLWLPYDWTQPRAFFWTCVAYITNQFIFGMSYGIADMFFICTAHVTRGQFRILGIELRNVLHTALIKYGVKKEKVSKFYKIDDYTIDSKKHVQDKIHDIKSKTEYDDENEMEILQIISREDFRRLLDQELIDLIKYHESLLNFFNDTLSNMFSPALGIMLIFSMFYIVFLTFCIVTADNNSTFFVLSQYLIAALTQALLFTLFSHMMTVEAEELTIALYDSPWHLYGRSSKSNIKFMLSKLQEPVEFKGLGYFLFSIRLFAYILKTSFSVFTMLQKIMDKKKQVE